MIGGAIPGKTETVSIKIYEFVDALQYGEAHRLAAGLLIFGFVITLAIGLVGRPTRGAGS
jgi:molybdate transport system permease protein